MTPNPHRSRLSAHPWYPWVVVGLLWLCGFFNYADRQALTAAFPAIEREFKLSDGDLGALASAFMIVYSVTSPFTGYAVDLLSRRLLIPAGLAFWNRVGGRERTDLVIVSIITGDNPNA